MTVSDRYGRLLVPSVVSSAVRSHLESWLVPFIAEVERQMDLSPRTIAPPASYETVSEFTKFDTSRLPSVVIAVGEINADPTRHGDRTYTAIFPVAIAVVCSGRTPQETERNSQAYGAAVRGAMLYHFPGLSGIGATGMDWAGESYAEIDSSDRRTKAATIVMVEIRVEDVARDYIGAPLGTTPPVDPYAAPAPLVAVSSITPTVGQNP